MVPRRSAETKRFACEGDFPAPRKFKEINNNAFSMCQNSEIENFCAVRSSDSDGFHQSEHIAIAQSETFRMSIVQKMTSLEHQKSKTLPID